MSVTIMNSLIKISCDLSRKQTSLKKQLFHNYYRKFHTINCNYNLNTSIKMENIDFSEFSKYSKKILGAAFNYHDPSINPNFKKPPTPVMFLKPSSSYISEGQDIKIPKVCSNVVHEVELGVIIGKTGKNISIEDAKNYIGGYCLGLDLTANCEIGPARDVGYPWSMGKGFDTATPISRFIKLSEINDPDNLRLWLTINGEMKQDGSTKFLAYNIAEIISYSSKYMTLEPNDLLLTGTPTGSSQIKNGDILECGLGDNLLKMKFNVRNE